MKRVLASVLALALACAAVPTDAAAAEPIAARPQPLRDSIDRAVEAAALPESCGRARQRNGREEGESLQVLPPWGPPGWGGGNGLRDSTHAKDVGRDATAAIT